MNFTGVIHNLFLKSFKIITEIRVNILTRVGIHLTRVYLSHQSELDIQLESQLYMTRIRYLIRVETLFDSSHNNISN